MLSPIRWIAGLFAAAFVFPVPAQADWYEAKSKHFIIYANENPAELHSYADKLERFDQAVRLLRGMDDPDLTDSGRVTIFVLPDVSAVQDLEGSGNIAGFYTSRASGAFAWVPRTTSEFSASVSGSIRQKDQFMSAQEVFFHEYAHHLQLQNAHVAIPTWAVEGFAEFFATADIKRDGSVTIGKFPDYRWYGVHDRDSLPIDQMLGQTYETMTDPEKTEALYARGWLLTDYLAMTDDRKGQFTRYIQGIRDGMTPLASAKAAFGDLDQLEHDMDSYSGHLSVLDIDAKVLHVGDIAVRPLRPGEAALIDVRMHSKRGVNKDTAPGIAAKAERAAADYPDDPVAQGALAEAEYDAKNYKAADAAADRALAADPKDLHALIYKGRAQVALALALKDPKTADWDSIRHWFVRANQVDTENAEALDQFYLSFAAANQPVNGNAVDAVAYAADLAPLDVGVRMTAVGALLSANRTDDAEQLLAPVLALPHIPQQVRDFAQKVMVALKSGGSKQALDVLNSGADKKDGKGKAASGKSQ